MRRSQRKVAFQVDRRTEVESAAKKKGPQTETSVCCTQKSKAFAAVRPRRVSAMATPFRAMRSAVKNTFHAQRGERTFFGSSERQKVVNVFVHARNTRRPVSGSPRQGQLSRIEASGAIPLVPAHRTEVGRVTVVGAQVVSTPVSEASWTTSKAASRQLRCFSSAAPASLFGDTVIVTKRCAERLHELRKAKSKPTLRLRLTVEGGGCSGFQYKFALEDVTGSDDAASGDEDGDYDEDSDDEDDEEPDHEFERDGAVLVVDDTSLGFVKGATVDFEEDMMRSAFAVVNNPASESACGCGSSFAIKNFEQNPALD